ncbi:TetR family transcriptional regulator [Williamsia sp. 1138]|uniref:TetR/AcrR family transcriptional regulator n=1 Tax=Williamsia sp. 1138 TaxID=1903117 RepID=UPI000A109870|nr:TetR/AcrR family transcriptional regulator [Williamsia sp. 1138]OZG27720.1 TetR family transcriptional regulator [Williamsia sp. 1138]
MCKVTKPKPRRSAAQIRGELMQAAVAELDAVGPEGASLRSIARRVGITHQSVAHHFADRSALFTAVAIQGIDDLYAKSVSALQELPAAAPLGESVAALGETYVRYARTNRSTLMLMFGSRLLDVRDPDLVEARLRLWDLHHDTVTAAVQQGWGGAVPADLIAIATFAMAHGLAALEGELPGGFPVEGEIEDVLRLVNAAVIAPPADGKAGASTRRGKKSPT